MTTIQSENLTREWEDDPDPPALWDSLQQMSTDPLVGISRLEKLAEAGSTLAMMHIGHIFLSGQFGVEVNKGAAMVWLNRSANCGSIEGAYRLASILLSENKIEEALKGFSELSEQGYSPATLSLGLIHYYGKYAPKNTSKSLEYFSRAASQGHITALRWKSFILMKERRDPISWIYGLFIRIYVLTPFLYFQFKRPGSDRLRVWI